MMLAASNLSYPKSARRGLSGAAISSQAGVFAQLIRICAGVFNRQINAEQ